MGAFCAPADAKGCACADSITTQKVPIFHSKFVTQSFSLRPENPTSTCPAEHYWRDAYWPHSRDGCATLQNRFN